MASKKDKDHARLLALLLAAYLLSQKQIMTLAQTIETGYLASQQAAYREAAATVGSDDATDWEPSPEQEDAAHEWAQAQAQGIADTYKADLTSAIETYLNSYEQEVDSLDGAEAHAGSVLGEWATKRATWKSEQIANYSCGSGGDAGTQAFIVDLEGGNVIDSETGEAVEIGDYGIACLPEESTNDVCASVAGQVFDISDRDSLPDMPAHGGCPHEYLIVSV
ncbi:MAG TPA: hypothetical protein VFA10_17890 [Ktedonobacteraceae bacterium]|nr:hypothetical protein [Ktedonobacteraceae bacterium]